MWRRPQAERGGRRVSGGRSPKDAVSAHRFPSVTTICPTVNPRRRSTAWPSGDSSARTNTVAASVCLARVGIVTSVVSETRDRFQVGRVGSAAGSTRSDQCRMRWREMHAEAASDNRRRRNADQNSICAPSSTTRFGGSPKNSVAERAFCDMTMNIFFLHRAMGDVPYGRSRSRPRT
jgi:hypothetical protein